MPVKSRHGLPPRAAYSHSSIVGSVIYRLLYAIVLYTKIVPVAGLKLVTAIVVGLAIATPTLKSRAAFRRRRAAARKGER